MINVCLDTCVWLGLLSVDFDNEDNYFEEICFWIEQGHVRHIVPINIIDEWNRNKGLGKESAVKHLKQNEQNLLNRFKNSNIINDIYTNPDKISEIIQKRIDRIDLILNTSEKADLDESILIEAGKRNLQKSPPNHIKEGYKDTVNVLSLIRHLKLKGYNQCLFSTVDGDFGVSKNHKHDLHPTLVKEFEDVNLQFKYFGNNKNISDDSNFFGKSFFSELRKSAYSLPSYQNFLKEKRIDEEKKSLEEKKHHSYTPISNPDIDFIQNIKYIDLILAQNNPSLLEKEIIRMLINSHDSYKQYFFNNLGNDGVV